MKINECRKTIIELITKSDNIELLELVCRFAKRVLG